MTTLILILYVTLAAFGIILTYFSAYKISHYSARDFLHNPYAQFFTLTTIFGICIFAIALKGAGV